MLTERTLAPLRDARRPMTDSDSRARSDSGDRSEHAQVLSEVLEDQKRRKEARDAGAVAKPGRDTSFFVQVALLVSSVLFFYLLFFSPTWIAPEPAPDITVERTEANIRWYLYTLIPQIDEFQEENSRLPENLDEIPDARPGTIYARPGPGSYQLGFADGPVTVTYRSSDDPDDFLGDAASVVLGVGVS